MLESSHTFEEDAAEEGALRRQARRAVSWLVAFLGIVLLAAALVANAQTMSATNPDGKITLTKEPCLLAGPWFAKWKAAKWMYKGKLYDACWSVAQTRGGGQSIMVIDSDGQVSQIDPSAFAPDEGV